MATDVESYATFTTEWWITDSGAEFADGDVGDVNHEGVVIQRLTRKFLMNMDIDMDIDTDNDGPLTEFEDKITEWLNTDYEDKFTPEQIERDPLECARQVQAEIWRGKHGMDSMEQFDDAWFCACGCGNHDARVYAMKYLGWKRVKGREIETWNFTNEDLQQIVDGIVDIANDRDINPEQEFNIEVRSTKKYYQNVPWSVIENKDVPDVALYE